MAHFAEGLTSRRFVLAVALLLAGGVRVEAGPLDEMALERWAKLREVERFQLQIAEKAYRENQFKIACDEYEKFLKLYERSIGAPYAQLKWSLCQVQLRNLNTAIKDGFQSVIDYYPDSPEAPASALLIGRTYAGMGDTKAARKAYEKLLKTYPKHYVAVMARTDLVGIAEKENEPARKLALLKEMTYEIERKGPAVNDCVQAARQLSQMQFGMGDFLEGMKALATTCKEEDLPAHLMHHHYGHLPWVLDAMTGSAEEDTKKKGLKVADEAVVWLKARAADWVKDEKTKPRAVQCWNHAASVQRHARRLDKELEIYTQMTAALGQSDDILASIADCHWRMNKRDLARQVCQTFKDPIRGQSTLAGYYREDGKPDPAVEIYRKLSVQDDKNRAKWLSEAAWVYRHRANKPDLAIAIYRELITSDVNNAKGWHWEVAATLYQYHRWSEALTAFRGTENFPSNYQHMATCNRQLKKYDEAITLYRQIMAGHPPHASWALLEIARTYEQAGKKEDAIRTYKLVCDRHPKSGEGSTAHRHLNEVYKITVTLGGAKD